MGLGMLFWLDEEEQLRLEEEIDSYEAYPLELKHTLEWKGPSLFPQSTAEATTTDLERRPVLSSLISSKGPIHTSSAGWTLELVQPLKVGKFSDENNNQVWRCRVRAPESGRRQHVVVKLYYDGLFPYHDGETGAPDGKSLRYTDGAGLAENEAMAYVLPPSLLTIADLGPKQ